MQPHVRDRLSRIRLILRNVNKGQITTLPHLQASRDTVLWMRHNLLVDRSLSKEDRLYIHILTIRALSAISRQQQLVGTGPSSRTTTLTQTCVKPLMESYV